MRDVPDYHANDTYYEEQWRTGWPYDNRSRRIERERENEAERKGDMERDED